MAVTVLPEVVLVRLRANGFAAGQREHFVDPANIARLGALLDRRGESWAASVLGRDISARALPFYPHRPALRTGDVHTLLAADTAEDEFVLRQHEEE